MLLQRPFVLVAEQDAGFRFHRGALEDGRQHLHFLAELADFPVETSLEKALDHKPDGVIIANPTALHLEIAIPAAQAGCSLLIEKPISHNLERIKELEDALASNGGQALVGFQFRFHQHSLFLNHYKLSNSII